MQLSDNYIRATNYFAKYGSKRTIQRLVTLVWRRLFHKRYVVFWLDLSVWKPGALFDGVYSVVEIPRSADLPEAFHARLKQEHAEELLDRSIHRRFKERATLWCLQARDELIGYTWTIPGKTLKPYFFPLTPSDVHIFDNFIFPAYRGHRLNAVLMKHVINALKAEGFQRAYIETGEWNEAELRSLDGIGFLRLAYGTKHPRQKTNLVTWWYLEREPQRVKGHRLGSAKVGN